MGDEERNTDLEWVVNVLRGNGKPGLLSDVAVLKQSCENLEKCLAEFKKGQDALAAKMDEAKDYVLKASLGIVGSVLIATIAMVWKGG